MHRLGMKLAAIIVASLGFGLVFSPAALAYIDPGSGSYIIQIIAATFLGAMVAVGAFWSRLKRFFSRNKGDGS